MRRVVLIGLLAASLAPAAALASQAKAPALRVVDKSPLTVLGTGFRPRERVVVTALTGLGPKRVVVRATATGRIGATFRLPRQPCASAFAINAVGALGSRATLHLRGRPCVPPPIG